MSITKTAERLTVKTPIGEIAAKPTLNQEYPGVWVSVNGEVLVLVEYDATKNSHVIRVWNSGEPEEECEYMQEVRAT